MSNENEVGVAASAPDAPRPTADQDPRTAQLPAVPPVPVGPPPVEPKPFSAPESYSAPAPAAALAAEPAYAGHPAPPPASPYGAAFAAQPPVTPPSVPYGGTGGTGGPGWGAPGPVPPGGERKPRRTGGLAAAVLAAALLAGGVGGGVGFWAADRSETGGSTTVSSSTDPQDLSRASTSVASIASKALPSVVTIEATGGQESGTGTGFVYDKEGHILTNNHVVAPAADGGKLTATFSDGRKFDAEVVGRAEGYDVAVIKLKDTGDTTLSPLALADSDKTAVGDATIAIGAPFGLSGTVTTGIVSAMHRPVASSDGTGSGASYMSAIQTDASINPGNSGGPLLNASGAVIGINSAIQSASDSATGQAGSVGLGFAIPINQAKRVANELIETGKPVYPVIGVQVDMQYSGEGAQISESGSDGADAVTPGGPADKAGLKAGDVITKLDDSVIDSGPTLIGEIWQHEPGSQVKVAYERGGKTETTTLTLGERIGDS